MSPLFNLLLLPMFSIQPMPDIENHLNHKIVYQIVVLSRGVKKSPESVSGLSGKYYLQSIKPDDRFADRLIIDLDRNDVNSAAHLSPVIILAAPLHGVHSRVHLLVYKRVYVLTGIIVDRDRDRF